MNRIIFYIIDLLGPLWLLLIFVLLMKKGVRNWKAWGVASALYLTQTYLVAISYGWNFGGYLLILISAVPSIIFGERIISGELNSYFVWIIPPLILMVIPSSIMFICGRLSHKKLSNTTSSLQ